jgi:UDP-N-acetylmuramyl tripeptide synthase
MSAVDQRLPLRTRVAVGLGRAVNAVSRAAKLGSGTVIGGRVTLKVDPKVLGNLLAGRRVALVSGTNGKTTTTRLLAAAAATAGPIASNTTGSNMVPGIVAALGEAPAAAPAILEVDEFWVRIVTAQVSPDVVALLNLSRDQLDRSTEVRVVAESWRKALVASPSTHVVANADDPLVAWAAQEAGSVTWVGARSSWRLDATSCPVCAGRIDFAEPVWRCTKCDFARPELDWWFEDGSVAGADGRRFPLQLGLPGRHNESNAVVAFAAAVRLGIEPGAALAAIGSVDEVAGRYRRVTVDGGTARLLLAKNPAGWAELLAVLRPPPTPVVVALNANIADGKDTSWIYDVPFEQLHGRRVVATGERATDLSVRLRYAEVDHVLIPDPVEAVRAVAADDADVAANYTSFQQLLTRLGGRG